MDGARDKFLAGACLPEEEDGNPGARYELDAVELRAEDGRERGKPVGRRV